MLDNLNKISSMYTDKYLTLGSSQGIYTAQKDKLVETLHALDKQVKTKNDIISTYDRELKDRMLVGSPYTFWRLRGVSTLQDWTLFSFFVVYGLVCLSLIVLAVRSEYAGYHLIVTLLSSLSIGVVIMGTIVRFA